MPTTDFQHLMYLCLWCVPCFPVSLALLCSQIMISRGWGWCRRGRGLVMTGGSLPLAMALLTVCCDRSPSVRLSDLPAVCLPVCSSPPTLSLCLHNLQSPRLFLFVIVWPASYGTYGRPGLLLGSAEPVERPPWPPKGNTDTGLF